MKNTILAALLMFSVHAFGQTTVSILCSSAGCGTTTLQSNAIQASGTGAGGVSLTAGTGPASLPTNAVTILAPQATGTTPFEVVLPTTLPTSGANSPAGFWLATQATTATANAVLTGSAVTSITAVTTGANYATAPVCIISDSLGGTGTGATCTATYNPTALNVSGESVGLTGSGYTHPVVSFLPQVVFTISGIEGSAANNVQLTAQGATTSGDIVTYDGLGNVQDSGISTSFSAHKWFGNNTGSTATAAASSIGTSDTTPNFYATASGSVNAYQVTLSPAMAALTAGATGCFKGNLANTNSAPTVSFNGLTAKAIVKMNGSSLANGDIGTSEPVCVIYDGSSLFELINPQASTGSGAQVLATSPTFITGITTPAITTTNLLLNTTAPTIVSGFGTTPFIVSNNGTAAFTVNVGSGGTASTGTIGLPTAANGWVVHCDDTVVSTTSLITRQTASTTTSASLTNYAGGTAHAWATNDVLYCIAFAF